MVEKPLADKLNLGSGPDTRPDFLNVDALAYEGVDVVSDVRDLKFNPETFREIYAKDIIEHVTFHDAKKLLRDCFEWLKPNGTITVHVHNMPYLASQLSRNEDWNDDFHFEVLRWIYGVSATGDSADPYQYHYWGYSEKSLVKIMRGIGYHIVKTVIDCDGFGLLVVGFKKKNDGGK